MITNQSNQSELKYGIGDEYTQAFFNSFNFYPEIVPTRYNEDGKRMWATDYGNKRKNTKIKTVNRRKYKSISSQLKEIAEQIDEEIERNISE